MPREFKTAADLGAAADRVLDKFVNGNITDGLDELADLPAVVAAYVAIGVYDRLPNAHTRSSWVRILARRATEGPNHGR